MAQSRYETLLRKKLQTHFNISELKNLCADLGIDHEELPKEGKSDIVRELAAYCKRHGRLPDLINYCSQTRPKVIWKQVKLFIGYNTHIEQDRNLAAFLRQYLGNQGYDAFIDKSMRAGTNWLDEIDQQIRSSDFLIVLLSETSADSEMVQAEVQRAYEYRRVQGNPRILPVRINYEGMLPYSIAAFLNPTQYTTWENESENEKLGQEILQAIEGNLPNRQPIGIDRSQAVIQLSEDGRPLTNDQPQAPLPEFDPRALEELDAPGGAVRIGEKFYVIREADDLLKRQLNRPGSITTIRAPRQTGKSSLLIRGINQARQQKAQVVHLDLQRVDPDCLETPDKFLYHLADTLARKLRLDRDLVKTAWQDSAGPQDKLSYFMEDHILPGAIEPIVLAIDEADFLLHADFHTSFFGMLRSWHNSAAYDDLWRNLNIILVISTEPSLLIADNHMSPFNVGLELSLDDFDEPQVSDLNKRHGSPVNKNNFAQFMSLLNGHPFLTRKALFLLVMKQLTWGEFVEKAATDKGPFSDHLRRQLLLLHDNPVLHSAVANLLHKKQTPDNDARYRLQRAGLIQTAGNVCDFRNDLYRQYFERKL